MFRLYFFTIYLIPSIYLYFRLKALLKEKKAKIYFTVIYILLVSSFSITHRLAHISGIPDISRLLRLGYCALPYLLYLFLTMLLVDMLGFINYLFKVVPASAIKSGKFRKILVWAIFLLPSLVVIGGSFYHDHLQVKRYKIEVLKRSSNLSNIRIAFAADLHIKGNADRAMISKFAAKINAHKPDIVLLGGDIFEGDREDTNIKYFADEFRKINAHQGIYTCFGNHEHHGDRDHERILRELDIKPLQDEAVLIDEAFYIIGRNDKRTYNRKTITDLLAKVKHDLPVIVLDHRPIDFENVSKTTVDIQLSGHTHHGQLFPLNFITKSIYDLSRGYKKIGNTNFFVTSGVQTWGPAVRTTGASEIMIIDVDLI